MRVIKKEDIIKELQSIYDFLSRKHILSSKQKIRLLITAIDESEVSNPIKN